MADPRYEHIGLPEYKVIEECAELISELVSLQKEITKAKRFGWMNYHPDEPEKSNIDRIRYEMEDVNNSMAKLEASLKVIEHDHYASNPTPSPVETQPDASQGQE